jgi:hypothetical protein
LCRWCLRSGSQASNLGCASGRTTVCAKYQPPPAHGGSNARRPGSGRSQPARQRRRQAPASESAAHRHTSGQRNQSCRYPISAAHKALVMGVLPPKTGKTLRVVRPSPSHRHPDPPPPCRRRMTGLSRPLAACGRWQSQPGMCVLPWHRGSAWARWRDILPPKSSGKTCRTLYPGLAHPHLPPRCWRRNIGPLLLPQACRRAATICLPSQRR